MARLPHEPAVLTDTTGLRPIARRSAQWFLPVVLTGTLVFLYLQTFVLPAIPIYQGDTAPIFLLDGVRMLGGETLYRDFFELTFPGTPLVYFLLFKLFGVRAWIPAAMLVVLGFGLAWLSIVISKRILKGASVCLPAILFLALLYGNALDAAHHWYSVLAVMAALAVVIDERPPARMAWAGALCGVAAFFTQTRGFLSALGFAAFLVWEARVNKLGWRTLVKAEASLAAAFALTTVGSVAWFAWKAGLARFLYCTVTFNMKFYSAFRWNQMGAFMIELPEFPSWLQAPALAVWIAIHVLVPMAYGLFLVRWLREKERRPQEPWDRLMLVNITGLFLSAGVVFSPSWLRLCTASLPALILLVWFVDSSARLARPIRYLLWSFALVAAIAQPVVKQADGQFLKTPVGRVALLERDRFQEFQWIAERVKPGEFFLDAADAEKYFLLGVRIPAEVPFLTPTEYTRPEWVRSTLAGLERHRVQYVLWSLELDMPEYRQGSSDHLGALRAYLRDHYRVVKVFPDGTQVWQRSGREAG